jgi:hypothetical protein
MGSVVSSTTWTRIRRCAKVAATLAACSEEGVKSAPHTTTTNRKESSGTAEGLDADEDPD